MADCPYAVTQCAKCNKQMRRIEQANHDCVKWLQSVIDNLTVQNEVQNDEIMGLHD